jgi:hypothetical protein
MNYNPLGGGFSLILSFKGGGAIGATRIGAGRVIGPFHFGGTSPGYSYRMTILPYTG